MKLTSVNPATGVSGFEIDCWPESRLEQVLTKLTTSAPDWANSELTNRTRLIQSVKQVLQFRREKLAQLVVSETGKLISEARSEIGKCLRVCDYYVKWAEDFLADEKVTSGATKRYVRYEPVGTILGIVPSHFPLWHAFRFTVPALAAGNTVLLKHASNVPQCALAIEQLFHDAGVTSDIFQVLLIHSNQVAPLLADTRIQHVAFTGRVTTGRIVAQHAGRNLKKSVMELGGSDAFIVLDDADIDAAVQCAVASRFYNAGQTCFGAKRIIVLRDIANQFVPLFYDRVKTMQADDPMNPLSDLGPLAREQVREKLHLQVRKSIRAGADPIAGCYKLKTPGFYYPASILDNVGKGMPAYDEELFGPVASIIHAKDDKDAIRIANDSKYGLGASIWSRDQQYAEEVGRKIDAGMVFINRLPTDDAPLPFGGVKQSGFGRQLGRHGLLEFTNAKTISINH
ncbi:MAG: NAD-dependent succinate-semialdehyde dehydrogenase [Gammaproteobacteria bacterium]|jgi:succinate-semialdehyde dehydrogenase/glutarate-semialdehyde dehydrogenase